MDNVVRVLAVVYDPQVNMIEVLFVEHIEQNDADLIPEGFQHGPAENSLIVAVSGARLQYFFCVLKKLYAARVSDILYFVPQKIINYFQLVPACRRQRNAARP